MQNDLFPKLPSRINRVIRILLVVFGAIGALMSWIGSYAVGNEYINVWYINNVTILGAVLHLILVLLILFPSRISNLNTQVHEDVRHVATCINRKFLFFWHWAWAFIGLLYIIILFRELQDDNGIYTILYPSIDYILSEKLLMDIFDFISSMCFVLCYIYITPSYLRRYHNKYSKKIITKRKIGRYLIMSKFYFALIFVMFIIFAPTLFMKIFKFEVLLNIHELERLLSGVIAILASISIGLLVGRLDSKFLQKDEWFIVALFLFAAIQTYSVVLYEKNAVNIAIFTYSAFTLKVIFFMFVSTLFERKKILYYALRQIEMENKRYF